MTQTTVDAGKPDGLRALARQRLSAGVAPPSRGWGVSVDALALLHRLASTPESAADALKLLHELQVHQVELDLQQAQLEANERELSEGLARYRALQTLAPLAYFVLDADGRVLECSPAGAELLGAVDEDVCGRAFGEFLHADSQARVGALLEAQAQGGSAPFDAEVQPAGARGGSPRWRIALCGIANSRDRVLLVRPGTGSPEG